MGERVKEDLLGSAPFAFVEAARMRQVLAGVGPLTDFADFADSWNRLELDPYMKDRGRYRRRRHAVFVSRPGQPLVRAPHQPHHQTLEYNPLHGGIDRWFAPIEDVVERSPSLQALLELGRRCFEPKRPDAVQWKVELHQFRIEAQSGMEGRPTPEGIHRDGVDYVLVTLVRRENVESGTTTIHDLAHRELGSFTLAEPLDSALVDDARAFHGVTPIRHVEEGKPGTRDVLVATWKVDRGEGRE